MNNEIQNLVQNDPQVKEKKNQLRSAQKLIIGGTTLVSLGMGASYFGAYYEVAENDHGGISSPTEEMRESALTYDELWQEAKELMDSGQIEEGNKILQSPQFQLAVQDKESVVNYQEASDDLGLILMFSGVPVITLGVGGVIGGISSRKAAKREYEFALDKRTAFYQEGKLKPEEEAKLNLLPPVGGKVYPLGDFKKRYYFAPRRSAQQLSESIIEAKRNGKFGDEFVHQITVQGRLPDQFKFAAMAMILHSPIVNDWTEPFFEASWGKIGPLIHDGGAVDYSVSPYWDNSVMGRTDFIQRVYMVQEEEIKKLEEGGVESRQRLPIDRQVNARSEQQEEERLVFENNFYQKAALALHARNDNLPMQLRRIKEKAADAWNEFEYKMKDLLLGDYHTKSALSTLWFRNLPTHTRYGNRYEASNRPIQHVLEGIERRKEQDPSIMNTVHGYMKELCERIDNTIEGWADVAASN